MKNIDEIRSPRYESNVDAVGGETEDTCLVCGKRTNGEQKLVQMDTDGNLTLDELEMPNSQGWYVIGKECIKKVTTNGKN